jgi:peptidylprolyl isomerase
MKHPLSRKRRLPLVAAAALLTITLAACGSEDDDNTGTDAPSTSATADSALPAWAPKIETEGDLVTGLDFTDTPEPTGELQVATVTEGDGPPVEVGQNITVNYYGSFYDSDTPFDESYTKQPATFGIGVQNVIAGWDQGIPGIPVGSRIIMSIPSDLAYGPEGRAPIPGDTPLYFVVDIISAA